MESASRRAMFPPSRLVDWISLRRDSAEVARFSVTHHRRRPRVAPHPLSFATLIICFLSRPPFCCPGRYSTFQAIPPVSRRAGSSSLGTHRLRERELRAQPTRELPTRACVRLKARTEARAGLRRRSRFRRSCSRADERIDWSQPCSVCDRLTLPG